MLKHKAIQQQPTPEDTPASVSPAKVAANRANAQKSTGPRTPAGKSHSRRNALKHGILSKQLLFAPDGTPVEPDLADLYEALGKSYDTGDIAGQLLCDDLLVAVWRSHQALALEMKAQRQYGTDHYLASEYQPRVLRYMTAGHNAKLKTRSQLEPYRIGPLDHEQAVDPALLPASEGSPQASTEIAPEESPAGDPVLSDVAPGDPGPTISEESPITETVQ